jgi:hypothetical protein
MNKPFSQGIGVNAPKGHRCERRDDFRWAGSSAALARGGQSEFDAATKRLKPKQGDTDHLIAGKVDFRLPALNSRLPQVRKGSTFLPSFWGWDGSASAAGLPQVSISVLGAACIEQRLGLCCIRSANYDNICLQSFGLAPDWKAEYANSLWRRSCISWQDNDRRGRIVDC